MKNRVEYHKKLLPIESLIKTFGCTYPGGDNYGIQQKTAKNHGDSDKTPLRKK